MHTLYIEKMTVCELLNQFEVRQVEKLDNIVFGAGKKVIDADDIVPLFYQSFTKVRA